ncbi:Molecular chaperone, DnaJ family protein, partial [Giardia duodenalis]
VQQGRSTGRTALPHLRHALAMRCLSPQYTNMLCMQSSAQST